MTREIGASDAGSRDGRMFRRENARASTEQRHQFHSYSFRRHCSMVGESLVLRISLDGG